MHEITITKEIIRILEEECIKNNIIPQKIKLELGGMTNYKEEPLKHYFEILSKGHKILGRSQLDINHVEGKVNCNDCKKVSVLDDPYLVYCKNCESFNVDVIQGKDLKVLEIISK
ncbi:hydrogenase maturation nickel metallochaperone HypA [Candidatus Woesearchaeota archaeon]|jgi:hydrogenase nickel insertion protein HypA|nr:hydrogenase maturation nickel metallochaperone HypA [Candidatus Woesearchaeota archaeon]